MVKLKPIHYALASSMMALLSSLSESFLMTHSLLLGAAILGLMSVIKGIASYEEGDHHCLAGIGAILCLIGKVGSVGGLIVIGIVFFGVYAFLAPKRQFA